MKAPEAQVRELAQAIANQAQAIADGNTSASPHAVAQLIESNVATLTAWTAPNQESGQ